MPISHASRADAGAVIVGPVTMAKLLGAPSNAGIAGGKSNRPRCTDQRATSMPRRRKPSVPSYKVEGGVDYGPSLRLSRDGRMKSFGGAAEIAVGYRDDPSVTDHRQIVRGARRRDVLNDLEARHVITKRMRDAAERFLEDCSIACGSSGFDELGMPSVSGPRSGLPERQVKAITRINVVRHLLGLNSGNVLWWVVFENNSVDAWEKRFRQRHGTGSDLLRRGLDALDEHYNGFFQCEST
jgi:hypothetical protein